MPDDREKNRQQPGQSGQQLSGQRGNQPGQQRNQPGQSGKHGQQSDPQKKGGQGHDEDSDRQRRAF